MNQKDKAAQLVDHFIFLDNFAQSKECALILTDEVLIELEKEGITHRQMYWKKVQQEINQLK